MRGDERHELIVRFVGASPAHANRAALELRRFIRAAGGHEVAVEVRKDDAETQDFGSTLAVLLGTPALVAVAQGVRAYIAKWGDQVVIETSGGRVIARGDGVRDLDVAATVAALEGPGSAP